MNRFTVGRSLMLVCTCVGLSVVSAAEPKPSPARKAEHDLREEGKLKPGDKAPDFTLKTLDGKRTVRLSEFQGKKPVALVFGSYT